MTTIQLEAVQLTQIEDDDGRWRRAFSGRITGGQYVAVCDELLNLEVDGKVGQVWSRRSTSMANANREAATTATVSVALVLGLLLRRGVNRFLDEGDPRRQLIAQAVLYAGAFIVIAVSMVEAPRVSR